MLANRHAWKNIALATALTVCSTAGSNYQVFAQQPAAAPAAAASQYKSIPVKEEYKSAKAIKELEDAKKAALGGNFSVAGVTNHYKFVLLPQLTSTKDPQDANAATILIRQDLEKAQKLDSANLTALSKELFSLFKFIESSNNYTPGARINSALLIGELIDERATSSAPAKPHAAATKFLITEIENGQNDGLKAAALVGLGRHIHALQASWNDQTRNGLATKLLAIAMAPQPPKQSPESHAFIAARCLQLMREFKHDKDAAAVAFATDILANEFTHPILREEALEIVGKYAIPDDQQAKLVAAGRYSMRYMKQRLERWYGLYDANVSATGGGGGGGGMGPGASYGGGYAASAGPGGMSGAGAAGPGAMYGLGKKEDKKAEKKPWEKQDEETKMLRRFMHEIVQIMRFGLSGTTKDDVPEEYKNGLLSKMPEGEERALLVHAMGLMEDLQEALNDEDIEKKSDFATKKISEKVDNLIAIAEQYPGAVDKENEAIVVEEEPAPEAAADETADAGAAPVDPTVGVNPAQPADGAEAPAQ